MGLERGPPKENDVRASFSQQPATNVDWCNVAQVTIDMLPDVALLEIFHFYVKERGIWIESWHTLVHVCREWRNIVFESPRRLNLRLLCRPSTPVREMLGMWPPLPIVMSIEVYDFEWLGKIPNRHIAAAVLLEHNNRICEMHYHNVYLGSILDAMMQPFPALTCLSLQYTDTAPVVPDSFLGGSAPLLRSLTMSGVPFPGLPNLLLSAAHLVHLELKDIPHSGYLSPNTMATTFSTLTRLEYLTIEFKSFVSRQKSPHSPLLARAFLPVLTDFHFRGVDKYLEDLVVWMDAPILKELKITFFDDEDIFDCPQLSQFICRAQEFNAHDEARLEIDRSAGVSVTVPQKLGGVFNLEIIASDPEDFTSDRLTSLVQVCNSSFPLPLIPSVERLRIFHAGYISSSLRSNPQDRKWLELFHLFTAVKALYISCDFVPYIVPALHELIGERVTEVLPALQTVFLENLPIEPNFFYQEGIERFVAARQLAGRPITVSWE